MATTKNDAASKSGLFSEGEKVLAFHGPRIYEAKVQRAESVDSEWRFYVHYLGWNKNWDEWVGADRLLKHTSENVLKQQCLDKKPAAAAATEKNPRATRSHQAKPKTSSQLPGSRNAGIGRGKKRKTEAGTEVHGLMSGSKMEGSYRDPHELIKIQIPTALKKQLVDDCLLITQKDKLVKLPRSPTVDDILKWYLEYRSKKDLAVSGSVGEILKGLRCYFDRALPSLLLYENERPQYRRVVFPDGTTASSVYGAEHLLRLFVKLPELLGSVSMEEETLIRLQQKLLDLLRFLQKNQTSFFAASAYEDRSPD